MTPSSFQPACKYCKSTELEQNYSRFATPKSEDQRLESMADPSSFAGLDENDPGSVARWMKKMGKEMGEDFGEDIDQMSDAAAQEAEGGESAASEDSGTPGTSSDDL